MRRWLDNHPSEVVVIDFGNIEYEEETIPELVTALQQTKLVKIWLNRQHLQATDRHEQQMLDEEAEAISHYLASLR